MAPSWQPGRFIRDAVGKDDPYFLTLSWCPPHYPYMAPAYTERYAGRDIELRANVPEIDRSYAKEELRGYYAAIEVLDDCFSRLIAEIERLRSDDTIIVFTSDHGDMVFSHGLRGKLAPLDEPIRVPLMMSYPRRF